MKLISEIIEVSWHRNGICGRGFHVVRFVATLDGTPKNAKWLAILTDDPGECYVICTDMLETHGVRFAGGNSWRGDNFEPELRKAIEENESSGSVRIGPFGIPTT